MKLILSRKGFDSSSGGVPSPIFPDGTMISLPIPDKASTIAYKDIAGNACVSVGELVQDLAGRPPKHRAHLDPDLSVRSIPRADGWKPLFGQESAAESHLENQGVGPGDIFLFFGLFRRVQKSHGGCQSTPTPQTAQVFHSHAGMKSPVCVCLRPSCALQGRENQRRSVVVSFLITSAVSCDPASLHDRHAAIA
jgi:hypothetical protein